MNPKWFDIFKDFYGYSTINKILTNYYKYINFNNLKEHLKNIIEFFSNNNNLKFEKIESNQYLSNYNNIRVHQDRKKILHILLIVI